MTIVGPSPRRVKSPPTHVNIPSDLVADNFGPRLIDLDEDVVGLFKPFFILDILEPTKMMIYIP